MGQSGMKLKWRAAVFLLTAALYGLSGCSDQKKQPPTEYMIGEESVPALAVEKDVEVSEETAQGKSTVYTYSGLATPGTWVEGYAAQLTREENGFLTVDEEYVQTEAPDFAMEEGMVFLARDAQEEGRVLLVTLEWSEGTCTVTVERPEGHVEPEPLGGTSLAEAVDYLYSLAPSVLGLSGNSMSEYQVYALDGIVFVEGLPCLQLSVCSSENPEQTNEIMGIYLLSGNRKHIYRMDTQTDKVVELKLD